MAVINKSSYLSIRFAQKGDVQNVMKFIDRYFKSDHILSRDQELFEYLYLEKGGNLNFVIATEVDTGRDVAILGFVPTNSSRSRVSLALWQAINDKELRVPNPGLACFRYLIDQLSPKSLFCLGIKAKTKVIYEFMGFSTGVMDHYFILNQSLREFNIIVSPPLFENKNTDVEKTYSVERLINSSNALTKAIKSELEKYGKDVDYFCHRYMNHPSFNYEIIEVMDESKFAGIVVSRRCIVGKSSCLRIIDVVGGTNCLAGAMPFLVSEMFKNNDEYIDLVSWGLDRAELEQIGFINRRKHLDCIVPELFSPFVPANKDIWFFSNLMNSEQFFKGDGDQDRPN